MARTLYGYFLSGPSHKVASALAMLDLPYSYRHVDLLAGAQVTPAFLALNPFGQVPVLVEDGVTYRQSGVILQHLVQLTGRMGGRNRQEQADVNAWMFWDFDLLIPAIFRPRAAKFGFIKMSDAELAPFRAAGQRGFQLLEAQLGTRDWLVGDGPTIADVSVAGSLAFAADGDYDLSTYPAVAAYAARYAALPGVQPAGEQLPKTDRD